MQPWHGTASMRSVCVQILGVSWGNASSTGINMAMWRELHWRWPQVVCRRAVSFHHGLHGLTACTAATGWEESDNRSPVRSKLEPCTHGYVLCRGIDR